MSGDDPDDGTYEPVHEHTNRQSMGSGGKARSEHQSTPYHLENKDAVPTTQTSQASNRKLFKIDVPDSQGLDWVFPGHLSDPLLMARVEELSGASKSKLGNTTQGAKGKRRRAKKAARAARDLEKQQSKEQYSDDSEPTPKSSAPQSSRQVIKRHG